MVSPDLATWMTPMDRDILELLYNEGNELLLTPGVLSENTDWSRQAVREHLMELRRYGLIEYHDEDRAIYRITERGAGWVIGDIPTSELEDDSEKPK